MPSGSAVVSGSAVDSGSGFVSGSADPSGSAVPSGSGSAVAIYIKKHICTGRNFFFDFYLCNFMQCSY